MKAKVIKAYTDKLTGSLNRVGEEVELSAERFEELSFLDHVRELIEEPVTTEEEGTAEMEVPSISKPKGKKGKKK